MKKIVNIFDVNQFRNWKISYINFYFQNFFNEDAFFPETESDILPQDFYRREITQRVCHCWPKIRTVSIKPKLLSLKNKLSVIYSYNIEHVMLLISYMLYNTRVINLCFINWWCFIKKLSVRTIFDIAPCFNASLNLFWRSFCNVIVMCTSKID